MNNKYNEQITITRTSENGIAIDCTARIETIERSIIGLFKSLNHIDTVLAIQLISELIDIAARKEK